MNILLSSQLRIGFVPRYYCLAMTTTSIYSSLQNVPGWIVHMWSKRNNLSNPEMRNMESLVPKITTNKINDNQINRIKYDFNWTDKKIKLLLEIIPALIFWILFSRFLVPFHVAYILWNTFLKSFCYIFLSGVEWLRFMLEIARKQREQKT